MDAHCTHTDFKKIQNYKVEREEGPNLTEVNSQKKKKKKKKKKKEEEEEKEKKNKKEEEEEKKKKKKEEEEEKKKKKEEEQKKKMKKKRKKGCRTETGSICSRIIVIMIIQVCCEIQGNIFQRFR